MYISRLYRNPQNSYIYVDALTVTAVCCFHSLFLLWLSLCQIASPSSVSWNQSLLFDYEFLAPFTFAFTLTLYFCCDDGTALTMEATQVTQTRLTSNLLRVAECFAQSECSSVQTSQLSPLAFLVKLCNNSKASFLSCAVSFL